MKLDQWGCGCTHNNQLLGHLYPCPLAKPKEPAVTYSQARDRAAETRLEEDLEPVYVLGHPIKIRASQEQQELLLDYFKAGSDFGAKYVLESAEVQEVIRILQRALDGNMIGTGTIAFDACYALAEFEKFRKEIMR